MKLYHNIRKLYTPLGISMVRGTSMASIAEINDAVIVTRDDGMIEYAGPQESMGSQLWGNAQQQRQNPRPHTPDPIKIDCRGLTVLPGFVDSHTHGVFAGERSLEFTMRAEGKSYQEIVKTGGGIRASVQAVQSSSIEAIVAQSKPFIE